MSCTAQISQSKFTVPAQLSEPRPERHTADLRLEDT